MTLSKNRPVTGRAKLGQMKTSITQAEAVAFKKRWAAVNAAELAELRATPLALKARQLAALMSSMQALGWTHAPDEDKQAQDRWNRLRKCLKRV